MMSVDPAFESKPVRALAGAADVAATTLRDVSNRVVDAVADEQVRADVRNRISGLSNRVSTAVTDESRREELRQRVSDLGSEAKAFGERLPERFKDVPARAAELPVRAKETFTWERRHEFMSEIPARVREAATEAAQKASKAYDDLADRGEGAVARWRGEYTELLGDKVAAIRGRVADAADNGADAADQVADDLGQHAGHESDDATQRQAQ